MKHLFAILAFSSGLIGASESVIAAPDLRLKQNIEFAPDWNRYPMPTSIIDTLRIQFPGATPHSPQCLQIDETSGIILGENSPLTGAAPVPQPNSAFIVWYTGCVAEYINGQTQALSMSGQFGNMDELAIRMKSGLIGEKPFSICKEHGSKDCTWQKISPAERETIIAEQIERLVGPEDVIVGTGLADSTHEFAAIVDGQIQQSFVKSPKAFAFLDVDLSSGDMTLEEAIRPIQFLILLNDTLKY
jgi:hypothetical protein